jgi:aldehyde dehydrogenase (NAD+)
MSADAHQAPIALASYVAGDWVTGQGPEEQDLNPARPEEVVATFRTLEKASVERAISAAAAAFEAWRRRSVHDRAAVLKQAARLLDERCPDLAVELTREQGKTVAESVGELTRAAEILRFNASLATVAEGEAYASPRASERIWTLRVPVGPVAVITPWNVPVAIPAWKIAPALLYGNTVVWKPARLVPLLAFRFMQALADAGVPEGVCNLVFSDGSVADILLSDPRIRACSFTGSTEVGRRLVAYGAQHHVKVQAEMGGKNAAVVLDDANLDWAIDQVLSGSMYSTGQRCTATSRALVARPLYSDFVDGLVARARQLRVGDPLEPATEIGPLASSGQHRQVLDYYRVAVEQGAHALAGGSAIDDPAGGFYVEPTVLVDVAPDHRVFMEEVFGPLVAVVPVDSDEQALELANRGRYGLAGAIFSSDIERVLAAVERFDVGVLHVNSETCGADPHVPFGGVKDSGTADREMGTGARDFYTESKTVYLRAGAG